MTSHKKNNAQQLCATLGEIENSSTPFVLRINYGCGDEGEKNGEIFPQLNKSTVN